MSTTHARQPALRFAGSPSASPNGSTEVAAAIEAAREAGDVWGRRYVRHRLRVIRKLRRAIGGEPDELASLVDGPARDRGRTLTAEVLPLLDACRFLERRAAGLFREKKLGRRDRPLWLAGVRASVRREPHGVVLIIAPGNYPLLLPGVQTLQALVAGNAVLIKPGPGSGAVMQGLGRMLEDAGLPPSLFTVLEESAESAQAALAAGVDKVVLTGSAETGRAVARQAAETLTPTTMELSGCDAAIALHDAEPDLFARAMRFGVTLNAGATCIAPRRAFVVASAFDAIERALREAFAAVGAMDVPPDRRREAMRLAQDAVAGGATVLAGSLEEPRLPLVLKDVPADHPLMQADLFAPVLTLTRVADADAAVRQANRCAYGLGATVFGRDPASLRRVTERLDCGCVVVNDVIVPTADPRLPFGGRQASGFGVTRGAEGLLEMTRIKTVSERRGARPHLNGEPVDGDLASAAVTLLHGSGLRRRLAALGSICRRAWNLSRRNHQ